MPQGANIAVSIFSFGIFIVRPPCRLTVSIILPHIRERGNSVFAVQISNLSDIGDGLKQELMKSIADLTVEATVLSCTSANSKNLSVHLKVLYCLPCWWRSYYFIFLVLKYLRIICLSMIQRVLTVI